MAAEMAALRLPEFHSATALHAPAPPQWRRPAGEAPRPFLVKGAGQLSCSPRMFQKVSRRLNSNGHAQINAATYSSRPTAEPGKWVGGRWKAPWERPDTGQLQTNAPAPASQRRPATADRLAESSCVSQQEYARFYEVQTGSPPTARVLAAFVASQSLGVKHGSTQRDTLNPAAPTTAKQRRNQRVLESIGNTTRYKEPYPRPPRDPSGNDPRGGAAHTVFASSLRDYIPSTVRGYADRSEFEAARQLNRPSFVLTHVGPAGCDPNCRSISDFGIWLTASDRELTAGVDVPPNTSKTPYRNRV